MNANNEYVIPVGTEINTRNVTAELRLRKHVTKTELRFTDVSNTGDGGFTYYFKHGDWLIAVDARNVRSSDSLDSQDTLPIENLEKSAFLPLLVELSNDGLAGAANFSQFDSARFSSAQLDKSA